MLIDFRVVEKRW